MASIQSNLAPLEISTDAGVTWDVLVCLTAVTLDMSRDVNRTSTFCGTTVGLSEPAVQVNFEAQCETAPVGNQVTYEDMLALFVAGTEFQWRQQDNGTGANFYHKGTGYCVNLSEAATAGEVVNFTGTIEMTGVLDIAP
jgi:hypothetical protein